MDNKIIAIVVGLCFITGTGIYLGYATDAKIMAFYAVIFFVTAVGFALGYVIKSYIVVTKTRTTEERLSKLRLDAQEEASKTRQEAQEEAARISEEARKDIHKERQELQHEKDRLAGKESKIEERQSRLDSQEHKLDQEKETLAQEKKETLALKNTRESQIEKIAGLSKKEAYAVLLKEVEEEESARLLSMQNRLQRAGDEQYDEEAKNILTVAIQRFGNAVDNDIMSTYVNLPDDETKGKIIGKEGRNIKSFEKASGVQLLVDDTPNQVTISSYDPIRRVVAKTALEKLIKDGRIQPARIEEVIEEAKRDINETISKKGKEAAAECEVHNLDPELLNILGRLYFRYSFGQNVLQHSIEMSHVAKVLATEIGADVYVARAGALLHDIGKAVDHEVDGTHVEIGRRILQKYGVDEEIVKAMQAHHEEYPYESLESRIVQTADAISGSRQGARNDNADMYIQKLEGLERIARTIEGVEDVYAVSAGREVRIFVNPSEVNDFQASKIARKVAAQVEKELKYPGEIKVMVIREKRVIEYAR